MTNKTRYCVPKKTIASKANFSDNNNVLRIRIRFLVNLSCLMIEWMRLCTTNYQITVELAYQCQECFLVYDLFLFSSS